MIAPACALSPDGNAGLLTSLRSRVWVGGSCGLFDDRGATRQSGDSHAQVKESKERVIRGGAFNSFKSTFADPAFRHSMDETAYTHGIGFRCAYEPDAS